MPAKQWEREELRLAGAMDTGSTQPPDLTGPLLELFNRDRWEVSDDEYQILLPSMRFASNLIRVGIPYLATFLSSENIFYVEGEDIPGIPGVVEDEDEDEGVADEYINMCPAHIPLKKSMKRKDLREVEEELEDIAEFIRWQLNGQMVVDHGWVGITRLADEPRPWKPLSYDDIDYSDGVAIGSGLAPRRPLIIGIMEQYADTLRESSNDSEEHLRATFMAGITMVHEIGHAVFHQDYKSFNPPDLREPYVEDDCVPELGSSFVSWLFGGFHPDLCDLGDVAAVNAVKTPLLWRRQYNISKLHYRPLFKTLYSISMAYIQKVLTQEFWDLLGPTSSAGYHRRARAKLSPSLDLQINKTATAKQAEWLINPSTNKPTWKGQFRLKGFSFGDKVHELSNADVAIERALKAGRQVKDIPKEDLVGDYRGYVADCDIIDFSTYVSKPEDKSNNIGRPLNHFDRIDDVSGPWDLCEKLKEDQYPPLTAQSTLPSLVKVLCGRENITLEKRPRNGEDQDTENTQAKRLNLGTTNSTIGGAPPHIFDLVERLRTTSKALDRASSDGGRSGLEFLEELEDLEDDEAIGDSLNVVHVQDLARRQQPVSGLPEGTSHMADMFNRL